VGGWKKAYIPDLQRLGEKRRGRSLARSRRENDEWGKKEGTIRALDDESRKRVKEKRN